MYAAFEAASELGSRWQALAGKRVAFAVYTATPSALPGSPGLGVHPDAEYVFYQLEGRALCVAKELLARFLSQVAPAELRVRAVRVAGGQLSAAALADPGRLLAYASGDELVGLKYRQPWAESAASVVPDERVGLEQGTGLVPVPAAGERSTASAAVIEQLAAAGALLAWVTPDET